VESSGVADSEVSATAAVSKLTEPTSAEYNITECTSQYAEGGSVAVAQNESLVDHDASVSEEVKPPAAASATRDLSEGAGDGQELDYNEDSEVEQLSEMPGTPASLPSLVSEPDDTCTPVKFLKVSSAACISN